jgi:hypothetical protein
MGHEGQFQEYPVEYVEGLLRQIEMFKSGEILKRCFREQERLRFELLDVYGRLGNLQVEFAKLRGLIVESVEIVERLKNPAFILQRNHTAPKLDQHQLKIDTGAVADLLERLAELLNNGDTT